jgi:hypothetical protein
MRYKNNIPVALVNIIHTHKQSKNFFFPFLTHLALGFLARRLRKSNVSK